MFTVYVQKNCASCNEALHWLAARGIAHTVKDLNETAPSVAELRTAAQAYDGNLRKLFRTACIAYRHSGLKDQLSAMNKTTAYQLLSHHGELVRRPFLVGEGKALIGFVPVFWQRVLG
jgi:Spx/MgsR family transcriptional regulator